MKVSIVVPVYNAASYIRETVEMVKAQTYSDWELILVNDCSTDNSLEILDELSDADSRIKVYSNEKNSGAAMTRNNGVSKVNGRFLAFLDADDKWMPNKLEKQLAFMEEHDASFCFTAYEFGDENAKPTGKIVTVPEKLTYRKALSRTIIFTTTVMFDLEKIDKKLIHMPNIGSEDTATWWSILRTGVAAYGLNEVLAIYRRPAQSLSSNKAVAIMRIWYLYREQEGLSVLYSFFNLVMWAYRATMRRI